jgi:hypothetical protein
VSYLDDELAFNGVEPLVLIVVEVSRRAAPLVEGVFQDEQTVAVLGAHLEGNGADAEPSVLAESVFACGDSKDRGDVGGGSHRFVHGGPPIGLT